MQFTRDDINETVIDNVIKLMWQDDADVRKIMKNWQDAIDYCTGLTHANYNN